MGTLLKSLIYNLSLSLLWKVLPTASWERKGQGQYGATQTSSQYNVPFYCMEKTKPLLPLEWKSLGDMVSEYALSYLPAASPHPRTLSWPCVTKVRSPFSRLSVASNPLSILVMAAELYENYHTILVTVHQSGVYAVIFLERTFAVFNRLFGIVVVWYFDLTLTIKFALNKGVELATSLPKFIRGFGGLRTNREVVSSRSGIREGLGPF